MSHKLTSCKSCGAQIAQTAQSCPNCGAKQHLLVYSICAIIIVITVAVCAFLLFSPSNYGLPSTNEPTLDAIQVSATDLWAAYAENQVNADGLYKDKLIAITGIVSNIGKDILNGDPCVSLESGSQHRLYPIQCFFLKAT